MVDRVNFTYVHIRFIKHYVYHISLQDTIQLSQSFCLLCQAILLPMPLRPLLLTMRSGFMVSFVSLCQVAVDVLDQVPPSWVVRRPFYCRVFSDRVRTAVFDGVHMTLRCLAITGNVMAGCNGQAIFTFALSHIAFFSNAA